jgi:hypothetical protein
MSYTAIWFVPTASIVPSGDIAADPKKEEPDDRSRRYDS